MKMKINKSKTFIPLSSSRGTTEQRFQKARLLNLSFYQNLQDHFDKREVKPSVFKRVLKETAGRKLSINIFNSHDANNFSFLHYLTKKGEINGYMFLLPLTYWDENIRQSHAPKFLRKTQKFFNMALNPKISVRMLTMMNKGYNNKSILDFYRENIESNKVLKKDKLNSFLEAKSSDERINTLQMFRYNLLSESNFHKSEFNIDRYIEKTENMRMLNKNYNIEEFKYDEKLKILNEKLAETLSLERKKR